MYSITIKVSFLFVVDSKADLQPMEFSNTGEGITINCELLFVFIFCFPVPGTIESAQRELKILLPQKFHIPNNQLRLLNSVGHGNSIRPSHIFCVCVMRQ